VQARALVPAQAEVVQELVVEPVALAQEPALECAWEVREEVLALELAMVR